MSFPSLKIAGIDLSIVAWLDFDQSIEPIGGSSLRRMANGQAFKSTHWHKHRISLSGSGWVPAPLNAIDYSAPFEIELPHAIGFNAGDPLPTGWTSRAAPWDEKTVTDQTGSTLRLVYPKITVIAEGPRQTNGNGGNPSWELVCEEA